MLTSLQAGVLKPKAATLLVGGIRKKYPDIPIHVHTHDSAGTGVASMVACAQAGADAVDSATDSMSGMTSQPSIGAILASLEGSDISTGLNVDLVRSIDAYWAQVRLMYSPFEAHLTGPDPGKSLFPYLILALCLPFSLHRYFPLHVAAMLSRSLLLPDLVVFSASLLESSWTFTPVYEASKRTFTFVSTASKQTFTSVLKASKPRACHHTTSSGYVGQPFS